MGNAQWLLPKMASEMWLGWKTVSGTRQFQYTITSHADLSDNGLNTILVVLYLIIGAVILAVLIVSTVAGLAIYCK